MTGPNRYFLLVGTTRVQPNYTFTPANAVAVLQNTNGMYDLSNPWNVPSGYVLLNSTPGATTGTMMLSDVYYADGSNWDKDNDGVLDIKLFSEQIGFNAVVGRWPATTVNDVKNISNKTMMVQPASLVELWSNDTWKPPTYNQDGLASCASIPQYLLDSGSTSIWCSAQKNLTAEKYNIHFVPAAIAASDNKTFVDYFTSAHEIVSGLFHGSLEGIEGMTSSDVIKFSTIFPLYLPQSCSMVHYYLSESSNAFSAAVVNTSKGPASLAIPPNYFAFFQGLAQGKNLGDAFYPKESNWNMNYWYTTLFGDPTLHALK